jgi:hypothetical protein
MAWYEFLMLLAQLVDQRKYGGNNADIIRLLKLGAAAGKAGVAGKEALEQATAKVKQLVTENRGLTNEEEAALDASIEDKLTRAAAVEIPD